MGRFFRYFRALILVGLSILVLAACNAKPAAAPSATASPDPCGPQSIVAEATQVNDLMREFDDASQLASSVSRDQLVQVIPSLQEIRRRAQDQAVPSCLTDLKTLQLTHMNSVINTLLSFVSGANANQLVQGIQVARTQHESYNRELARLLGATYEAPPTSPAPALPDDTATATLQADTPAPSATTPAAWVTNPGPGPVNVRSQPVSYGTVLGQLDAGLSMAAVGKTPDGKWIQVVDAQGNTGWVYASVVQVTNGGILPVVTPVP
jgi:hypothetical protein